MKNKYKIVEDAENELKERLGKIEKDISAFANSKGGTIHIGVDDCGYVQSIKFDNAIHSQIINAINNVEPRPKFYISHADGIIKIKIPSGSNKPYRLLMDSTFVLEQAVKN